MIGANLGSEFWTGSALLLTLAGAGVLAALMVLDVAYRRVPNALVFPATAAAIGFDLWLGSLDALLGAAVTLALFAALAVGGRRLYGRTALGMGDVKLAMLVGALLGVVAGLVALTVGMALGGLLAWAALQRGTKARQVTLPYGAALAAGALLVLVWQIWLP